MNAYQDLGVLYVAVIVLWFFQKIPRIIADLGMASHIVAVVNPGRSGLRKCTLLYTDQKFHSKYAKFFSHIYVQYDTFQATLRIIMAHRYTVILCHQYLKSSIISIGK